MVIVDEVPSNEDLILAKTILIRYNFGVLSTVSQNPRILGYPFGSVTPYALDENDQLIIFISEIAEHTKNIIINPKVSLTIIEDLEGKNIQAKSRLTYIGDAKKVNEDEFEHLKEIYIKKLPHTKDFFKFKDFYLYRIEFQLIRFIVTFSKVAWISIDDYNRELD